MERKQCNKVWLKFKRTTRSVNDGLLVQKDGELVYYFGAFLGIETSFDLKILILVSMYELKVITVLKWQPKTISFIFWKLRTPIDFLFFSRTNIGWTQKI